MLTKKHGDQGLGNVPIALVAESMEKIPALLILTPELMLGTVSVASEIMRSMEKNRLNNALLEMYVGENIHTMAVIKEYK